MTAADLIEAFETLADAPEGVARLRELVLQLAVRGKLVPQDPGDEPASVLLERIAAEKARLVKEGKIRKQKALPPFVESEGPFRLPHCWSWCRFDALLVDGPKNGWSPKGVEYDTGVRTLKLSATTKGVFDESKFKFVDADLEPNAELWLKPGDLLIQRSNTPEYVGMAAVFDGATNTFIYPDLMMRCRLTSEVSTGFVHRALICPFTRAWFAEKASGTSQSMVKLNQAAVRSTLVPFPPLAEQHRIVARVDELMGLLDRLQAAREARNTTRSAARDASLAALREADTPEEVETAWNRLAERMDDLVTEPADIEPLRQTVLQLAVRGRLVAQDPGDEPASVLLERIGAEKVRLVAEKKVRKRKALSPLAEGERPSLVPKLWCWRRLGEIATELSYGTATKSKPSGKVPVLRMGNLQGGEIDWTNLKYTDDADEISKYSLVPGAVLFNRTNSPALVGKTAIYRGERQALFAGYLIRVGLTEHVVPDYANWVLNAPFARKWCWDVKTDGVSQSNISGSKLALFPFPLPPPRRATPYRRQGRPTHGHHRPPGRTPHRDP